MPARDLALIREAVAEAGRIALGFWRKDFRQWDKDAGAGPVTEADLAVNTHLENALRAARPDYGWLSEESPDDPARLSARLSARRVFVVDPIDGTRAFIDGQEGFAVAVAVVEAGRPIAGVVHLPARGVTYAAAADGPALRDGRPISPSDAGLPDATVLTTRATLSAEHWRGGAVPPLRREFRPSLAWRLCLVAEGRFDATMSLRPVWDWDIAAASLIAERAGCVVTDRQGQPLRFNSPAAQSDGMLVAGPRLAGELLARLDVPPGGPLPVPDEGTAT